jgi:hypothetical protein
MSSLTNKLPASNAGRCTVCHRWLFYQRVDSEAGILTHFFFCRRCGRRYAAWEMGWTPGQRIQPLESTE